MTDTTHSGALYYLPVEVSGQQFAIPMADVVAVHSASASVEDEGTTPQSNDSPQSNMPVIDLQYLYWGEASPRPRAHVVVIATDIGAYAVLVDGVRPARTAQATDQSVLPRLVASRGLPFSGVVSEVGTLVLIIDCRGLAEMLWRTAPELIVEIDNAA